MFTNSTSRAPLLVLAGATLGPALLAASLAAAGEAVSWEAAYGGDVIVGWDDGQIDPGGRYLDNLELVANVDLDRAFNWRGASLHADLLNNSGAAPNERFATLQGVDNIEVSRQRVRLFEFWVEQSWDRGSVRAGLYDLNSEFYANESAGLLIGPAFGIGSELAATGPNGPSIFPSTALAVRALVKTGAHGAAMFAALNADAGVLGDPGGVDTDFDHGALVIGEYKWSGERASAALGAWGYSQKQDDIRDVDGFGNPLRRDARGVFLTYEQPVSDRAHAFVRVGVSDGDTTPYRGGWQGGLLIDAPLASRPNAQVSIGAYQGLLGAKHRANETGAGVNAARAESGLEITYSDRVTPWLRVQPDVQLVLDPGGDRDRANLWVFGLRFAITPSCVQES